MLGSFADNIPSWVNLCTPRSRRNIGQQECISSFLRESLYKYVLGSLKKYPNRAFLATSNNFLDLDHQIILDFLDESGLNDTSPQSVLQIAAAWLQRNHEISRPDAVGNKESGIHLKSFVINLKLHDIRTSFISELWGEESPHTTDILAFRSSQLLQEFLVMPDVGDLSGFICHNVETGGKFLPRPTDGRRAKREILWSAQAVRSGGQLHDRLQMGSCEPIVVLYSWRKEREGHHHNFSLKVLVHS